MEINDLRIFQMVANEKSISKAAFKLGYAQSNITMRIKVLENELNTSLFVRNNKGTLLTLDGEKLLRYADKILNLVDEATEDFKKPNNLNTKLTIGATQTISSFLIPNLFYLFHKKNPTVALSLKTERQEVLLDMLTKGDIEGIFIYDNCVIKQVKEIVNFTEEIVLISASAIDDIKNIRTPIIVNTDNFCPYHKLLIKWFVHNHAKPSSIIAFDTLEAILRGVSSGLGVSLLPQSSLPDTHNFHVYNLEEGFDKVNIKFIVDSNKKSSDALKDFISISFEHVAINKT
ncbi:putative HTH-type transcriptional regulator YusT [Clostridium zeae]|uniref:HTH-type transcriptional regulator YusT n=1 Tax=Clostridium zeae TaxID=2759022 RepID=A0ABQ1E5A2_9CLOT|nr:LysR family transcriptional regulator [Clostridium zeae]GFZ29909.1 putative HTH-type transcriptional regulator YusT [Clostridium zeae]